MINDTTNGEAIVTTDVGQHQMWAAQYYKFNHPRSWITSGGLEQWASDSRRRSGRKWPIRSG
ncbi:thiamine pyrophosphate-dependent enzyme [Paenibacillus rhizoplanae]